MLTNDNILPVDHFAEAQIEWAQLGTGDEGAMTTRSIFTLVRLSLKKRLTSEELSDIVWMLRLGVVLADLQTYDPRH